jgi:TatD DNase family protein
MAISLVDSHCHLNLLDLSSCGSSMDAILDYARRQGVNHFLNVSVELDGYAELRALTERYPDISLSVGVHPCVRNQAELTVMQLNELATDSQVVAIGETGLDYFHAKGQLDGQRDCFRTHIRAAINCGKPLIIHSREAKTDTLRILKEESADRVGGVMHCFTEDWDMAKQAIEMGFYISFSGIVTFKNAATLREVARKVPLNRLLVETDSPYLAPVPHRGKPNQPAYVRCVAQAIADIRTESLERLAQATTNNFFNLFNPA